LPQPDLSVIICSYNGADGIHRCLAALREQTIRPRIEVIVVDDGSTDDTAAIAAARGARVVRHGVNRGASAARNTGIREARSEIVAFLDDDCEPAPRWADALLTRHRDGDRRSGGTRPLGVGGAAVTAPMPGVLGGFLTRHSPLLPLELALQNNEGLLYRLGRYVRAQWSRNSIDTPRAVFSLPGAGMSFRRADLSAVGMLDERIRFGGEDFDLCRRLAGRFPDRPLIYDPGIVISHHFKPDLGDTLRRSRAYARGAAHMCRKWPTMGPIVFPVPLLVAALLGLAVVQPAAALAAAVVPYLALGSWMA
jgi:glycosyltransferase involved in cell wall biosynthesis